MSDTIVLPFEMAVVPPEFPFARGNAVTTAFMNESIKRGLYEILADQELREDWESAFYHLGVWSTVQPEAGDFGRVEAFVRKIENAEMDAGEKLPYLAQGYRCIGRIGDKQSAGFLEERMLAQFWKTRPIQMRSRVSNSDIEHLTTAQTEAIAAYSIRGDPEAIVLLRALENTEEHETPKLREAVRIAVDSAEGKRLVLEQDRAFFRLLRKQENTERER